MAAQTRLPFELDGRAESGLLTALGGVPLLIETALGGVPLLIEAFRASAARRARAR
jgi:hypothetical protein